MNPYVVGLGPTSEGQTNVGTCCFADVRRQKIPRDIRINEAFQIRLFQVRQQRNIGRAQAV